MKKFFVLLCFVFGVVLMNAAPPPDVGDYSIDKIEIVADQDVSVNVVADVLLVAPAQEVAYTYIGDVENQSAPEITSEPMSKVEFAELTLNNYTSELFALNKPPTSLFEHGAINNHKALNSYQRHTSYPLRCY